MGVKDTSFEFFISLIELNDPSDFFKSVLIAMEVIFRQSYFKKFQLNLKSENLEYFD